MFSKESLLHRRAIKSFLTMTFYFILICTVLIGYVKTWDKFITKINEKNNDTTSNLVVKSSFANENFFRCNCTEDKYACKMPEKDIKINIEDFLNMITEGITSNSNNALIFITIGLILLLTIWFLVESCISQPVPMEMFILGDHQNSDNEMDEEMRPENPKIEDSNEKT